MIAFKYDHTRLSPLDLHRSGIRGTRELEEVIEGYSFGRRQWYEGDEIYLFVGFTKDSKPLEVAFKTTDDIDIITEGARVANVEKIIKEFCRYCYPNK